jgi:hypothetical protein
MNQQVTFLSDGGDTVRQLQLYLHPQAEHLLDWFHVVRQEAVGVIVRHGGSSRPDLVFHHQYSRR